MKYEELINEHRSTYQLQLATQQSRPFIVPLDIWNYLLLIVYLVLSPKLRHLLRFPLFIAILALSANTLWHTRTIGLAYGVVTGIMTAWCPLLSLNFIFLNHGPESSARLVQLGEQQGGSGEEYRIHGGSSSHAWQAIPEEFTRRLCWCLDLVGSVRGLHWSLNSAECWEQAIKETQARQRQKIPSLKELLLRLILGLVATDCLKALIAADPCFWGRVDAECHINLGSLTLLPKLDQVSRLITAFLVIYLAIQVLSTLGNVLFLHVLGPSLAGTWGHPWAHAPAFGDFSAIGSHGLRGFWGSWWHQFFRLTLDSPASAVARLLTGDESGRTARTVRMVTAFLISGALHACASLTLWGPSQPSHTFYFFALQPVGILTQAALAIPSLSPPMLCTVANFGFTAYWLLVTSPLLVGDYASGALWMTEAIPFSILALLGLSRRSLGTPLWAGFGVGWYRGERWWLSGLAF
ncbi:MAG: hypothetical protein Q9228_001252 [Teloschistes exilis]